MSVEMKIVIDGKEYTREEAEKLYKELCAILGKPEKVIERIVEPRPAVDAIIPWRKRYNVFEEDHPLMPKVIC